MYLNACTRLVVAANRWGMLDNMSGGRMDTPLMKAAANGTQRMAGTGRGRVGG
jgi:hypothetical protein